MKSMNMHHTRPGRLTIIPLIILFITSSSYISASEIKELRNDEMRPADNDLLACSINSDQYSAAISKDEVDNSGEDECLEEGIEELMMPHKTRFGCLVDTLFGPFMFYYNLISRYVTWFRVNKTRFESRDSLMYTVRAAYTIESRRLAKEICSADASVIESTDDMSGSADASECRSMDFVLRCASKAIDLLESSSIDNRQELIDEHAEKWIDDAVSADEINESMRELREILYSSAIARLKTESVELASLSIKMLAFYAIGKLFEEANTQQLDLVWPMFVSRFCRYDFNLARKYVKSRWRRAARKHLFRSLRSSFSSTRSL